MFGEKSYKRFSKELANCKINQINIKMKIAIVTMISDNYGACLQCYALQKILQKNGHSVTVINRGWYPLHKLTLKEKMKNIYRDIVFHNPFKIFRSEHLNMSNPIYEESDLYYLKNKFDVVITGSDQVWNYGCIKIMKLYFYLDWVDTNTTKRYSYAASFGTDSFPVTQEQKKKVSALLATFSGISVREKSGQYIMDEIFNLKSKKHLDPTLLLNRDDYNKIISEANLKKLYEEKYICKFFLDSSKNKEEFIADIAKKIGLPVVDNYPLNNEQKKIINNSLLSVQEWLRNIRDAKLVVTDSFHGTVFCLIFNVPFISINNSKRGSTRFSSLLSLFNQEHRLIDSLEINDFEKILQKPNCLNTDDFLKEKELSYSYIYSIK